MWWLRQKSCSTVVCYLSLVVRVDHPCSRAAHGTSLLKLVREQTGQRGLLLSRPAGEVAVRYLFNAAQEATARAVPDPAAETDVQSTSDIAHQVTIETV